MTAANANTPETLCAAILEEARQQRDQILGKARQEAEAILSRAQAEADRLRASLMSAAQAEAKRRSEAILATVAVEVRCRRALRLEELLESVRDAARARLRAGTGFDLRSSFIALAAEAISHMEGNSFRLTLSPATRTKLGRGLAEAIILRVGRPSVTLQITESESCSDDDAIIADEEGRQSWNVGLTARLERCWPQLRRQIAAHLPFEEVGRNERGTA